MPTYSHSDTYGASAPGQKAMALSSAVSGICTVGDAGWRNKWK